MKKILYYSSILLSLWGTPFVFSLDINYDINQEIIKSDNQNHNRIGNLIGKINTICKFKENVIPYLIKITQGKKLLPVKEALRKIRDMNWEKIQQFFKSDKTGGIGNEGIFGLTKTWESSRRKKEIIAAISAGTIAAAAIGLKKIFHNEPCKHLEVDVKKYKAANPDPLIDVLRSYEHGENLQYNKMKGNSGGANSVTYTDLKVMNINM